MPRRPARIKFAARIKGQGLVPPCENERPFPVADERKLQPANDLALIRKGDVRPAKVLCEPADARRASSVQRASRRPPERRPYQPLSRGGSIRGQKYT